MMLAAKRQYENNAYNNKMFATIANSEIAGHVKKKK